MDETLEAPQLGRENSTEVLVLGIGNLLWADEGFGVRAAEAFAAKYAPREGVRVADGGTLGGYLVNDIIQAKRLLLLDCCDFREPAGTLKVLRDDDIAIWSTTKVSAHQTGMNDVLATAQLLGHTLEKIAVVGVQPVELNDFGGSLTPVVEARVGEAIDLAAKELAAWGFPVLERDLAAKADETTLSFESLTKSAYEEGRPSEAEAPRTGDVRFFAGHGPAAKKE